MSERDAVFPAGRQALYERNKYSAAVRSGDLLFDEALRAMRPSSSTAHALSHQTGARRIAAEFAADERYAALRVNDVASALAT